MGNPAARYADCLGTRVEATAITETTENSKGQSPARGGNGRRQVTVKSANRAVG
ncbi:hypothetical protein ACTMU2_08220 [Cupriavidus basilensis]